MSKGDEFIVRVPFLDVYSFKQMRNVVKSGLILNIPKATQCGLLSAHILTYQQLHVILIAFQLTFVYY
jgi:hypothetical protein